MARTLVLPGTGDTFGRLTVVMTDYRQRDGRAVVQCRCSCGGTVYAKPSDLRRGTVTSCGCARRDVLLERNASLATHRMSNSPERHIWRGILSRCLCRTSKYYPGYGGRGISVCDRWV